MRDRIPTSGQDVRLVARRCGSVVTADLAMFGGKPAVRNSGTVALEPALAALGPRPGDRSRRADIGLDRKHGR